ncbi:MAG: hypothetical protein H0U64_06505 [Gemmatimonadaceae bacterium]|nr:hypothetical protein [Gemmatimonadaceae bacterium]
MHNSYVVPVTEPSPEERVSFLGLVNFLFRNLVLLVLVGAAFALILVARRATSPVSYTAFTTFSTGQEESPGKLLLGLSLGGGGSARSPQFYADLVKSSAILGPLVESKFQVSRRPEPVTLIDLYAGNKGSAQALKEAAMGTVAGRVQTKISPLTSVITMRVTASEPKLASDIARRLLAEIDLFNTRTRKAQSTAERAFSEERLLDIQRDVRMSEDRLRGFLERNREISLSPSLVLEKERLNTDVIARRQLYTTVLIAYERAKMEEVRENPLVTIISEPMPPLQPDAKGIIRLAVLGFFAGFLLAMVIALWKEYLQNISRQSSPEFKEFSSLRENAVKRVFRPFRSLRRS